jgi:hypothetical protein
MAREGVASVRALELSVRLADITRHEVAKVVGFSSTEPFPRQPSDRRSPRMMRGKREKQCGGTAVFLNKIPVGFDAITEEHTGSSKVIE